MECPASVWAVDSHLRVLGLGTFWCSWLFLYLTIPGQGLWQGLGDKLGCPALLYSPPYLPLNSDGMGAVPGSEAFFSRTIHPQGDDGPGVGQKESQRSRW